MKHKDLIEAGSLGAESTLHMVQDWEDAAFNLWAEAGLKGFPEDRDQGNGAVVLDILVVTLVFKDKGHVGMTPDPGRAEEAGNQGVKDKDGGGYKVWMEGEHLTKYPVFTSGLAVR